MASLRLSQLFRATARPRLAQSNTTPIISSRWESGPIAINSRHFSRLSRTTPATDVVKSLKTEGCVILESILTPSQVARLNSDLDTALLNTTPGKSANTNTPPLPDGLDPKVYGQNTKRLGDLLNASPAFREEIIEIDALHSISGEIFKETGDYWLSTAQMIELGPGSKAQPLHADAAGWWPFWSMGNTWQPEIAVNFLFATTDTTKANGATGVVRGSHTVDYAEVMKGGKTDFWEFPDEKVEQVELKAGDCLLLGGRVVHRGAENRTSEERRRLLSCTVISSAFTPEEAHPLLLGQGMVEGLSERAKKFLGFRELGMVIGPDVWQDHREGGLKRRLGF